MTPIPTAAGTQRARHRRVRQPIATIKIAAVRISTVRGSHPPSKEMPWPNLLKLGSGRGGISVGVGTGGAVVGPMGGTPSVSVPLLKER
jgi:hypothetical protein